MVFRTKAHIPDFHEIWRISCEISQISWNPVDFSGFHEILRHSLLTAWHETEEFLLSYLIYKVSRWIWHKIQQISRNLADFTWNLVDLMKSAGFQRISCMKLKFLLSYLIYKVSRWIWHEIRRFHERPIARNGKTYVSTFITIGFKALNMIKYGSLPKLTILLEISC